MTPILDNGEKYEPLQVMRNIGRGARADGKVNSVLIMLILGALGDHMCSAFG